MKRSFSRQELHDLVWSKPGQALSVDLGISDVWLSKVCKEHDVPRPPRGHWAKLAARKTVSKLPLPKRPIGVNERITIGDNGAWTYEDQTALINTEIGPPPTFDEPIEAVSQNVRKLLGKVSIPRDFTKAHGLISKLLQADAIRRDAYLANTHRFSWDAPYFDSPFERRRLRLLNALMICLQRHGFHLTMREKNPSGFSYKVGQQDLWVTVDHPKEDRNAFRRSDLTRSAADLLVVTIQGVNGGAFRTTWEDKAKDTVEAHVEDIAVAMIVAGEVRYRANATSRHNWRVERKAQLIEERRQRVEREEQARRDKLAAEQKARIDSLLLDAAAHRQANDIRQYAEAVRNSALTSAEPAELDTWTRWALAQARHLDPISSNRWFEQWQGLPDSEVSADDEYKLDAHRSVLGLDAIIDVVLAAIAEREKVEDVDDGTALNSPVRAEAIAQMVRDRFFDY